MRRTGNCVNALMGSANDILSKISQRPTERRFGKTSINTADILNQVHENRVVWSALAL